MATTKKTTSIADDDFSFFNKIKVNDRYADKLIRHPDFGFCDSGSYMFNALLSGDLFGGFPLNRFIMVAGKQQSGKSFIAKNNFAYSLMQKGYYIFWYDTENQVTTFLGKYNFNLDKGTEKCYGFEEGDESWEVLNNTSDRVNWKSADYTSTTTDSKGNLS